MQFLLRGGQAAPVCGKQEILVRPTRLGAMRFLRAKVGLCTAAGQFGAPVTARELLLGVLARGALRICRRSRPDPDPIPTLLTRSLLPGADRLRSLTQASADPSSESRLRARRSRKAAQVESTPREKERSGRLLSGSPRLPGRRLGIENRLLGRACGRSW